MHILCVYDVQYCVCGATNMALKTTVFQAFSVCRHGQTGIVGKCLVSAETDHRWLPGSTVPFHIRGRLSDTPNNVINSVPSSFPHCANGGSIMQDSLRSTSSTAPGGDSVKEGAHSLTVSERLPLEGNEP
jgi:hypothetical protein